MRHLILPAAVMVSVLSGRSAVGQCVTEWGVHGTDHGRAQYAIAFDPVARTPIVFGGTDPVLELDDTIILDGELWKTVATTGPSARFEAAMAPDEAAGRVLLFGGRVFTDRVTGQTRAFDDTWSWNEDGWSRLDVAGPPARALHAMAYDSIRGRVVLFGGVDSDGPRGDTWEWTGERWELRATTGPSPRGGARMAFDRGRGRMVLFAGADFHQQLGDTWEWDGEVWRDVTPVDSPEPRLLHGLAYEPVMEKVVLYGGWFYPGFSIYHRDIWTWDGAAWTFVETGENGEMGGMVYDTARRALVTGPVSTGGFLGSFSREIRLPPLAGCTVDYTCDGVVDFGDYLEFLNLFDTGDERADLTRDGVVDFADYLEFLTRMAAGC